MKKIVSLVLITLLLLVSLAACQGSSADTSASDPSYGQASSPSSPASPSTVPSTSASPSAAPSADETEVTDDDVPLAGSAPITVISREDGSGTRGAFIELFGVLDDNDVDNTLIEAEITNSTSVMMASVAGNPDAIGYISLGSLNDTVKAAKIDGVDATVENIVNETYSISRPFVIATKDGVSELAQDFIDFIMSTEGQDVIEENGYIRVEDTGAYSGTKPAGEIVVAGSSSVSPVMEILIETYEALNTGAEIELQTSDSSAGMTSTIEDVCDIGMSSRELKDTELAAGLIDLTIAIDGIAVIVNNDSAVDNLTTEQVRQIFVGEITDWSGING